MDRSKPDGAGSVREGRKGSRPPGVKTIVVKLSRGGPQEWPYYRLSPRQKREWDAVEDIVERLAAGKALYSYGHIHAERVRSKYWIGATETRRAVGITALPMRNHLHEMLVCNVQERFCFVVANLELSDEQVMEVWRHVDACLPYAALLERHAYVHAAIVEMPSHDCFEVFYRAEDASEITAIIQDVVAHAP